VLILPGHARSPLRWEFCSISLYWTPLSPTLQIEYRRNIPGLQAFFCDAKQAKPRKTTGKSVEIVILKQMFYFLTIGCHKIAKPPGTRCCAGRLQF
jgi:hypothetical protein